MSRAWLQGTEGTFGDWILASHITLQLHTHDVGEEFVLDEAKKAHIRLLQSDCRKNGDEQGQLQRTQTQSRERATQAQVSRAKQSRTLAPHTSKIVPLSLLAVCASALPKLSASLLAFSPQNNHNIDP